MRFIYSSATADYTYRFPNAPDDDPGVTILGRMNGSLTKVPVAVYESLRLHPSFMGKVAKHVFEVADRKHDKEEVLADLAGPDGMAQQPLEGVIVNEAPQKPKGGKK